MLRIARKDPAERRVQAIKKCFHSVIEKPLLFIIKLTIPTSESEKWQRSIAMVNAPCALVFFLLATDSKCAQFLQN